MKKTKGDAAPITIERRKLDELRLAERNARIHPPEQITRLANSLREFGWTNPLLVDPDGEIIAGHGRAAAAISIRDADGTIRDWPDTASVPVIVLKGLTAEQRRAYRIADNKLTELGRWDPGLLQIELRELLGVGFDLALTGLGELELRSVNADLASSFLSLGDGEEQESPVRTPRGFVQLTFTVKADERKTVMAALKAEQGRRSLPTTAATLIAICRELQP